MENATTVGNGEPVIGHDDVKDASGGIVGAASGDSGKSSTIGQPILIDPASIERENNSGNGQTGEPIRKRRGRKPGSTNKRKTETISVSGLESILLNIHNMLSIVTSVPEIALDPTEAKTLAEGAANVARHYDLGVTTQKALDWSNLIGIVAITYGSRIIAVRNRMTSNEPEEILRRPPTETPIRPNGRDSTPGPRTVEIPGVGRVVRN